VTEGHFARVEWKKPAGGAKSAGYVGAMKMEEVPGSAFSMKVDLVLLAMGFVHVKHGKIIEELEVEYDPRGNIRCNPDYSTSAKAVFAAGDANTGASLIVRAIFHGREAAKAIDQYLRS
jgi:glutamate synthase (NADPH/NADH) small chain